VRAQIYIRACAAALTSAAMENEIRLEGLTLTVESVEKSIAFYSGLLGLKVEWNSAPAFAMIRHGAATIGLLAFAEASKEGVAISNPAQKAAIHIEFTTDNLDALYEELKAKGVVFHQPPHDEPWERSMTAFDPDGYAVEFAQGKRGKK
jgi:catechol 2,3-dioxygenase-like lactoylglutathione lyase family enzyme